jgi:hypothetical protein
MEDLQKMFDAKEYRLCLQQIARVMRGADRGGPIRYPLLLLRGDCLLHLNDGATARDAYQAAAKAPDLDQSAEAYATAFLISKSPGLRYTPRTGGQPISIVEEADRNKAMAALLNDEMQGGSAEIRRALSADTMQPILDAWPTLRNLYGLELTATGKTDQVAPLFNELGQHARDVLGRELTMINNKLQQIQNKSAQPGGSTMVQSGGVWWADPGIVRMGLTPDDRQVLREIVDYCPKIIDTAQHGLSVANRMGGNSEAWNSLITGAQQAQEQAASILNME